MDSDDKKITQLAEVTSLNDSDLFIVVIDPGTSPVTKKINVTNASSALTGTTYPYNSANELWRCDAPGGVSAFVGSIASLPGGATLTYNVTSGQELALVPFSTTSLAKLRLYNTTRGNYALISNSVAATNTITLTANVPAGWTTNDVITIASQTVSGGGFNWADFEITDANLLGKSALFIDMKIRSATAGDYMQSHSFETYGAANINFLAAQVANISSVKTILYKLVGNVITVYWSGTPSIVQMNINGYIT